MKSVTGQAYRMNQFSSGNMGTLNGALRDFGLAVPVPEPVSITLMGLGTLAGLMFIRRRKIQAAFVLVGATAVIVDR